MLALDDQQQAARDWFESLRDRICAAFEEIEREAGSDAAFTFMPWNRSDGGGAAGGGGVRGQLTGKVFERVGVNVSVAGVSMVAMVECRVQNVECRVQNGSGGARPRILHSAVMRGSKR